MSCGSCSMTGSGCANKGLPFLCGGEGISGSASLLRGNDGDDTLQGPHQAPRIWVLTADKHNARIFEKHAQKLELLAEISGHGRIAFTAQSAGLVQRAHVHTEVGNHDRKEVSLNSLSIWLDEANAAQSFDRLILVAPPRLLGEMRKILSQPVQMRIVAEVNKDLTKFNAQELKDELEKIVWF